VAGMGLPPPTPNHVHLYDALADAIARTGKVGVLVSPLPDAANGAWGLDGLVIARGLQEGAVKIRVLQDVARLGAPAGRAVPRPPAAGGRPATSPTSGGH